MRLGLHTREQYVSLDLTRERKRHFLTRIGTDYLNSNIILLMLKHL